MYSVGWAGKPKDTARAVLHQFFAAQGDDVRGQMAMGYRHFYGIGVPKSCQAAAGRRCRLTETRLNPC